MFLRVREMEVRFCMVLPLMSRTSAVAERGEAVVFVLELVIIEGNHGAPWCPTEFAGCATSSTFRPSGLANVRISSSNRFPDLSTGVPVESMNRSFKLKAIILMKNP
jgi:hypothetical protein